MRAVSVWQPPIISDHTVDAYLPGFHRNLQVQPVNSDPSGGSEIAPENQQRSRKAYAVDETVELDELEH